MIILNKIINIVVQPMLSGQSTSLDSLFGGETPGTIGTNGQSVVSSMRSALESQSSELSTIGSSMQSIMSGAKVFTGTGSILETLISLTGPSIMSTVFDIISEIILNSLLSPLFSQFTSSTIEDDFNILTQPMGGMSNAITKTLNITIAMSPVFGASGVNNHHYGSGPVTTTTGSKDPTGGKGFNFDGLATPPHTTSSSTDSSCNLNNLGECIEEIYNLLVSVSSVLTLNVNFQSITNTILSLVFGFEQFMGTVASVVTSKIFLEGILSTINDVLGYIKTKVTNSVEVAVIQFFRLIIDCVQTLIAVNAYLNSGNSVVSLVSQLWLGKSIFAGLTDFLSLVDNVNTAIIDINTEIASIVSSCFPTAWSIPGASFSQNSITKFVTNLFRAVLSIVILILTYLLFKNSENFLSNPIYFYFGFYYCLYF